MFRSFFNLKSTPFGTTADPDFLWFGEKYEEAISLMRYGISDNKGFLLLTGDAGTGKTSLINFLTESFDDTVLWTVINDPNRDRLDFYNAIARGFAIGKEITSKVQFLIQFSNFLHKANDEKKRVLLLIDDCHLLSQDMLEELRLLSNIEKTDTRLLNIFFIGQRQFQDLLIHPANRSVRQRLGLKIDLTPLTVAETEAYIKHRLKVAGTVAKIFSAKAVKTIHQYSLGNPRQTNILCDRALTVAAVKKTHSLDQKFIEECIEKLDQPFTLTQEDEGIIEKHDIEGGKAGFTEMQAILSDMNRENNRRWSRLKYGLAVATLLFVAAYLWFPMDKDPGFTRSDVKKVDSKIDKQEPPQAIVPGVVAGLDNNRDVLTDRKTAELKQAIVERVYRENETGKQESTNQPVAAEENKTDLARTDSSSVENQSGASDVEDQQSPLFAPIGVQDNDKTRTTISDIAHESDDKKAVQRLGELPVLPIKIVLPLLPNSLKLTVEANQEFENFVEKLKRHPGAKVLVKGYVSSNMDSPLNTKLSEERADAVRKMLIAGGIETARIQVVGMGNHEPLAPNNTSDGRTKNRRVEIIVSDNGR
jgi:general secretion pathway protein A